MGVDRMIKGIGASSGIAIGHAFVLPNWEWDIPETDMSVSDLALEFERLYAGIRTSKNEIQHIKKEISDVIGEEESYIFDAHLAILDDPVFMNEVHGIIRRQYKAAEVAVKETIEHFAEMFDLLDDAYMKERATDIKDVGNRLIKHLIGTPEVTLPKDNRPFILVAKELAPSQLANLNPKHVRGILTYVGGPTSHSAIMARALGIPLVLGLDGKIENPIQTGDLICMDGDRGVVYINPETAIVDRFQQLKRQWSEYNENLLQLSTVPTQTEDGCTMRLDVNISSVNELEEAFKHRFHGIGLFRTEFLFMEKEHYPNEEEQFQAYKKIVERANGAYVIIRTLDIGADKNMAQSVYASDGEINPVLGYRAIRLCLDQPQMFKSQLKAILRASHYGHVKMMYPLISSIDEVRMANHLLQEAKDELKSTGIPFHPAMEVGVTIEVPSAAYMADYLAEEVDFFSIGTNDLIQYILAVDRMNEQVAHLYDPFHPAVIRTLKIIVDAANKHSIPIAVCGEMAGDIRAIPIWLGLGIHDLSMSSNSILPLKNKILETNEQLCKALFSRILDCRSASEIHQLLHNANYGISKK